MDWFDRESLPSNSLTSLKTSERKFFGQSLRRTQLAPYLQKIFLHKSVQQWSLVDLW